MIKIPKEQIIEKIKDKTGLSEKDIQIKIKDKMDLLAGLISEEGAAHIIANELGVKVFDETGKLQVKNVLPGMRSLDLSGKIIKIYDVRSFEKDSRKGKVGSFLVGDQTGVIRVTAWNEKADLLSKMKEGDLVSIEAAYSKENNGKAEIHLGDKAKVTITEGDGKGIDVKENMRARKKISELTESEDNVEILGTIVQVFDPKFFEVCPHCNKRVKQSGEGFFCEQHNIVSPSYSYVVNLILDDNTETLRVVLWKNQAQRLFNMDDNAIIEKRNSSFEEIKNDLLGRIVKLVGRTSRNVMFDRIEFTPQLVFIDVNPEEEIQRINKELQTAKEKQDDSQEDSETNGSEADEIEEVVIDSSNKKRNEKKDEDIFEEIDDLDDLDSI